MVEAHVVDAWTIETAKTGTPYLWAVFIAGLAAPLFLFLAGVSTALAAGARAGKTDHRSAALGAINRGWLVFALAYLFRLQSQLLGWGPLVNFLKVDILNVMGLAIIMAGAFWSISASRSTRVIVFAIAAAAVAMSAPIVRESSWVIGLPDPIEAYIRPIPGWSTFALFPWAAFLFAGMLVGELISAVRDGGRDAFVQTGLAIAGCGCIAIAYWASFQPSIYPVANFWTSSPTFFFIRLGICTAFVPIARLIGRAPALVIVLGRSSLFVYWVHVEMVYGVSGRPLRQTMPLALALTATAVLCVVLYKIVLWKNRLMEGVQLTGPSRILAPVLK